jgi:hypothetical protein
MRIERHHVALAQSAIWVTTGMWPVVHMRSFEAVTGPKIERWLVRTVGLLIASIGVGLGLAAARKRVSPEMAVCAGVAATSLAGIDLRYALTKRISPVYLLDAPLELALAAGWLATWAAERSRRIAGGKPRD